MTYGQLFMKLNPNVKVIENGTCVWIYFDSVNHDTFRTEWWNKEIPDEALKTQEAQKVKNIVGTAVSAIGDCPICGVQLHTAFIPGQIKTKFCYNCGKAVYWNE